MPRHREVPRRWLTRLEVAAILGLKPTTFDRYWRRHEDLEPVRLDDIRVGRKRTPAMRWPEDVVARHQQRREREEREKRNGAAA